METVCVKQVFNSFSWLFFSGKHLRKYQFQAFLLEKKIIYKHFRRLSWSTLKKETNQTLYYHSHNLELNNYPCISNIERDECIECTREFMVSDVGTDISYYAVSLNIEFSCQTPPWVSFVKENVRQVYCLYRVGKLHVRWF